MTKEPLPKPTSCPECGGERVRTVLHVDNNNYSKIIVLRFKQEWLSGYPSSSKVDTLTCVECGHVQLYATEPHNLADIRPDAPIKEE